MRILTEGTTGVNESVLEGHLAAMVGYYETIRTAREDDTYASPESALYAPSDETLLKNVEALVEGYREKVRTVLLVGIGGSDLGTRAVYDALHARGAAVPKEHTPTLISFGTVELASLARMRTALGKHLDPEEVVLVAISKSGGTTESILNANVLFGLMSEQYGEKAAARQTIIISDPDSSLTKHAQEHDIKCIGIPGSVGGRYSVFTAVGLVPLALLGCDIRGFCEGAVAGAVAAAPSEGRSSAAVLAAVLYEAYLNDLRIHEMFMWHPELETLGKWYRQLLAESIGKERTDGTKVGITPNVAVGSVDLHSHGQLVFGGPPARFTSFVAVPSLWEDAQSYKSGLPFELPMLEGKSTADAMRAMYAGVTNTYRTHNFPYTTIELDTMSERELGVFMSIHMTSVMYLAQLLEVNAFDQPDVEAYKTETKRILHESSS